MRIDEVRGAGSASVTVRRRIGVPTTGGKEIELEVLDDGEVRIKVPLTFKAPVVTASDLRIALRALDG